MSSVGSSVTVRGEGEGRSEESLPTSEEYEVVREQELDRDGLVLKVGSQELEESLKECLEEAPPPQVDKVDIDTVLANENLLEDPDHTIFHNIAYLGSVTVHNPKDEAAIQQHMAVLNSDASPSSALSVTVSVPRSSVDAVVLREAATRTRIHSFRIHKVIFFARGKVDSPEAACFAFTSAEAQRQSANQQILTVVQCHVFRCQVAEAVNKIFISFARAFKKPSGADTPLRSPQSQHEEEHIVFEVGLEIREDDGKGNFVYVPRDKECFKLRANVEKRVVVSLQQISDNLTTLQVDRCFGMLVSPGRAVRHSDMQLLEGVKMTEGQGAGWAIQGAWDPREAAFATLNQETGPDIQSVYMTVAADLVIKEIAEPVRFVVETKARIFPGGERFWYYSRRSAVRRYRLVVRRQQETGGLQLVEVQAGEELTSQQQYSGAGGRMSALTLGLASLTASWSSSRPSESSMTEPTSPSVEEAEDSGDEPILSGSGGVSKECTETELAGWGEVLTSWAPGQPPPKQLTQLVRGSGIPEALRGEVWQRLSGAAEKMESVVENYRILVTKESPDEKVIFRDIHRTFPAHEFFKEAGGVGQEALFRISKAYSVYDSEIGYCQGQSFLIAALLLQMPEEQAFGVLVEMMHGYGLRDMFRENFEQLQLRFYQLERLVEKRIPDLWQHFSNMGLETHMYASQWFLTLFSAKFPLFLVFRVLDVFMLQGIDTIFQVSLALLMLVKKELLAQDFEGIMKYFRVNIPKKLRSEESAKQLMKTVVSIKVKKLSKYEKEWRSIKEAERLAEDPLIRYERENKKLLADNMRLERENDQLAQQLLTKQTAIIADLDRLEDLNANLERDMANLKGEMEEQKGEKQMLSEEADQLKFVLKREVDRMEADLNTKETIIEDYKGITKQLSAKLDKLQLKGDNEPSTVCQDGDSNEKSSALDAALEKIKQLELELAQTKLALVETECKNQDLTHQFNSGVFNGSVSSGPQSNTWLSKTLSSLKEATAGSGSKVVPGKQQNPDQVKKSSSEQSFGGGGGVKASQK